jgi:hypothetical protein
VAQVIALWYGSAALERLVDLSLSVESAYAVRIVRRVGARAIGQVEDIGDAGGAVGITKIVVLPIDPAVDHGIDHAFSADPILCGSLIGASFNPHQVKTRKTGGRQGQIKDESAQN